MRILVGCEESQAVTERLRLLGHEAYSCDLLPSSGSMPEYHFQKSIFEVLEYGWDLLIAFPPCTHLAISGAKHFHKKKQDGRQKEAIEFFMALVDAPVERICIENPVGIMSRIYRKPDQIIQPYHFGDSFQKTTCLWLKGLPRLKYTNVVDKGDFHYTKSGKKLPKWYNDAGTGHLRSKTFPGIAAAMAEQFTSNVITKYKPTKQLQLF